MDPAKVPINERVAALGVVGRCLVEAEVPRGVFSPGVSFKERVLIIRLGLNFAPVAVEHVLASVDQTASICDCVLIDRVRRHEISMRATRSWWDETFASCHP